MALHNVFFRYWQALQDLLFPPRCLHCDQVLASSLPNLPLCPACLSQLKQADPERVNQQVLHRIPDCALEALWIGWEFSPALRSLIHHLKYQKMPRLGIRLGKELAQQFTDRWQQFSDWQVVWVPLHPLRQRERGYNQSACIAQGIAHHLADRERCSEFLERTRATVSQTGLSRTERYRNVEGAFRLKKRPDRPPETVLVVDDVITTGATINECARVLRQSGVKQIIGVALATPPLEDSV